MNKVLTILTISLLTLVMPFLTKAESGAITATCVKNDDGFFHCNLLSPVHYAQYENIIFFVKSDELIDTSNVALAQLDRPEHYEVNLETLPNNIYKCTATMPNWWDDNVVQISFYTQNVLTQKENFEILVSKNLTDLLPPPPPTPTPIVSVAGLIAPLSQAPGVLFNDLLPLLTLIIGVPFGFWIIYKLIALLRKNFG